ncbi:MAG TPA: ring-cleaving dioxygenase, partial [Symbiobacteriaceae bacterium]|nr:ring-cleaving dioxygenase [Symbiobacteriaceae bacterium]
TFFDWDVPAERRGTRSITRTFLRVNGRPALEWWAQWLPQHGVTVSAIVERDGRLTLDFEDFEGQRLALVDDGGQGDAPTPWARSPVPAAFQIRGLGPILLSVAKLEGTDLVLTKGLLMRQVRQYPHPENASQTVYVYEMGKGGPHAEIHVGVQPDLPFARQGAGAVHHVALRVTTEADYHAWADRLNRLGLPNSGEVDRHWFRSLYFREPGGILFEIATDGPGFGVDEEMATLGEKVVLAPFLEPQRETILRNLKPID